jgi:hypothetical protein
MRGLGGLAAVRILYRLLWILAVWDQPLRLIGQTRPGEVPAIVIGFGPKLTS